MKKAIALSYCLFVIAYSLFSQNVGIGTNTPNVSALLDVTATNKGVLVPRVTNVQMLAIASPANGLLVYNTDSACFAYRNATAWVFVKGNVAGSSNWNTLGNAGTDAATDFIGTTDNTVLNFRVNNVNAGSIDPIKLNTFLGREAGNKTQTGVRNVGMGYLSFSENTTGEKNTAIGVQSLRFSSEGNNNTAVGYDAMFFNSSGSNNAAFGENGLHSLETGNENVAIGLSALYSNQSGSQNVAVGTNAGYGNTGSANVFLGYYAGRNETGSNKLYISNHFTDAGGSLIYGEFDNKILSVGGRLGIGTITPENLLHIKNANTDANASQVIIEGNSNYGAVTTTAIEFRSNFSSSNSGPSGRIKSYYASNNYTDAKTTFQTIAPGPVFVDAMTLTNGNVGIGTSTPQAKLEVAGTIKTTAAAGSTGLDLGVAAIKVSSTNPSIFTVTATAAVLDLVIPNTSMANSSTDMLIITHRLTSIKGMAPGVYWNGTNWVIFLESGALHTVGEKFNVMVIKQ